MFNHSLRRMGAAILSLALALSLTAVPAAAVTGPQQIQAVYSDIKVMLDGEFLVLTDANGKTVEPFSLNGTTYLPVRAVAGALGLKADWNAETHTVVLTSGGEQTTATTENPAKGRNITIGITADYADIKVTLDGKPLALTDANGNVVEPFAVEGTTYLPIRAISNALGLEVGWDGEYHVVTLSTEPFVITQDEAKIFVQGMLDKLYLGKHNPDFLELVGKTAEESETDHLQNVMMEAQIFSEYWGIVDPERGESFDTMDATQRSQIIALIDEIYAKSSYTVSEASTIPGTDNYAVTVTVNPINVLDLANAGYEAASDALWAKYENATIDQYAAYSREYTELVLSLVKAQMGNSGYLAPQTVTVRIEKDANASYSMNLDDLDAIDMLVIHYPET